MTKDRATVRVQFSNEYRARFHPVAQRHGDGYETKTYFMVCWDDCISFQAYAKLYIERI